LSWQFENDRPIYTQLVEKMELKIISGKYIPGNKLPSVRDLAAEASVSPNTMQKALAELELNGLLYSQRTSGRFVTEDKDMILKTRTTIALKEVKGFVQKMQKMGFDSNEIISLTEKIAKETKV
jgi:GntR family transcriptional regulator